MSIDATRSDVTLMSLVDADATILDNPKVHRIGAQAPAVLIGGESQLPR